MNCKYWNYNGEIKYTFESKQISNSLLLSINQQKINTKTRNANEILRIIIPILHHIYVAV